jgi:hypothetical protein
MSAGLYIEKAERLFKFCIKYCLAGYELLLRVPPWEMANIYNGVGPDWRSDILLKALADIHEDFEPAAFLHDAYYALCPDRSHEAFLKANADFLFNCCLICDLKYKWYDPRRYLRKRSAKRLVKLCNENGLVHWNEAWNKSKFRL